MKVTGHKKLIRQLKDLPKETNKALEKSIERTARTGAIKARAIVPVDEGDLKAGINHQVKKTDTAILGFINFFEKGSGEGIAANAINYGWPRDENRFGYHFRETIKALIADRHKRTVSRNIKKAIRSAMNG